MKKILIVGNGSTGVDSNGNCFVNKNTGKFLIDLKEFSDVSFLQYSKFHVDDLDLSNFNLKECGVKFIPAKKGNIFFLFHQIFKLVTEFDFIYIFFPGTLSRIFALTCLVRSKKYGIYLRGEKINEYFFDSLIISRANFILTVSPFFKEKLKHLNKDIEVIKPMIDISITDFFYCEKPINKEIIKILFVGRVEKRKGIFELLEIAKMIKFSSKQLQIDVVGGGELIEEINYLIVQNEIGHIIKLHGQVSDKLKLKEFYINSDLFLFLSHDEGFPRVLYEAMAYKLPIFTTFVGGIPGRMVNGFNCVEVPLQDPIKTFETILIQLCDQKKMSTIALNGQKTISKIINKSEISHHILLKKKIKV